MSEKYQDTWDTEEDKLDIISILDDMLRRFKETWWLYVFIICVGAAGGFLKEAVSYQEQYEASASFVVSVGNQDSMSISNYYNTISAKQMNAAFPYILTSGALTKIVANDLGMDRVPGTITAEMLGDTNLFQIKVVSSDPQMAYNILNSVVENYPQVSRYVIGDTQLKLLDESGIPESPMNQPAYKRSMLMGIMAGILLSFGIIFLRVVTRATVRNQEDLKKFLNVKYLAGLPQVQFKRRSSKSKQSVLVNSPNLPNGYIESMDLLQSRLTRALESKGKKTVMVTSALAGEGKTTTTCNIALTLAEKGYHVLLIDGDLRNPSVAKTLHIADVEYGLCDVLKGEVRVEQVMGKCMENLYVIPGGKPMQRVNRLYSSDALENVLNKYRDEMDIILVDTPPSAVMNDAALIAAHVEACVMVIREDFARRDKILAGAEVVSQAGALLVGCVINGETVSIGSYGKYGYGKYGYGKYGYGKYGYGHYEYGEK